MSRIKIPHGYKLVGVDYDGIELYRIGHTDDRNCLNCKRCAIYDDNITGACPFCGTLPNIDTAATGFCSKCGTRVLVCAPIDIPPKVTGFWTESFIADAANSQDDII